MCSVCPRLNHFASSHGVYIWVGVVSWLLFSSSSIDTLNNTPLNEWGLCLFCPLHPDPMHWLTDEVTSATSQARYVQKTCYISTFSLWKTHEQELNSIHLKKIKRNHIFLQWNHVLLCWTVSLSLRVSVMWSPAWSEHVWTASDHGWL